MPYLDADEDRLAKCGWGTLRLGALLACALWLVPAAGPAPAQAAIQTAAYLQSWSIWGHAAVGAIGATINTNALGSKRANMALLAGGTLTLFADVARGCGLPTLVYSLKTAAGDLLAGKLDCREFQVAFALVIALLIPALNLAQAALGIGADGPLALLLTTPAADGGFARILGLLFVIQLACEWGDANLERLTFFRHRYSFELATAALLAFGQLYPQELAAVQIDLVACVFYRAAGFLVAAGSPTATRAVFAALFSAFFWRKGVRMVRVRDPAVGVAVLAASDAKGDGLEARLACPAWQPALSLESVDGPLWREMRDDFNALMRVVPPPAKLQAAAAARLDALLASDQVIDADAVVRWSAGTFIEYLFDIQEWRPEFEVFVAASWEWRRQIAVRGEADPAVKAAAVRCLTHTLLPASPRLWALHGEAWREPRYYSLILQPFLISPCINLSDIAVGLAAAPPGASADEAVRLMHPFPILERLVEAPVLHPATGKVAVPAGAHAIMFTADLAHAAPPFPIFGAGPRACPGGPLMAPVLTLMQAKLVGCPRFQPAQGHTSSGRHNDANWSLAETLYFAKTVLPLLK